MTVIDEIAAERARQIVGEGWSPKHDDAHRAGEMAGAAACYTMHGLTIHDGWLMRSTERMVRDLWPWAQDWWKPKDRRRDLIRAAALIVAEIERLDRAAATQPAAEPAQP